MRSAKWLIGVLALVLVAAVVFFLPTPAEAATVTASGSCGENATYTVDSEGTLTISGTGPMEDYPGMNTPWLVYNIKAVVVEEGITTIGACAFAGFKTLVSVKLPDTVTTIDYDAFAGCDSLASVTIPNSVKTISRPTSHLRRFVCRSLASL